MHTPDGQYTNPILGFDVPDPDVIPLSTGGYAMVASSFDRRPGLPLWYSDDLADWRPVGFAGGYAPLLQPTGGVWAPAIRERDGTLFITWADPDRGVFVIEAPALTGPWTRPRQVIDGPGPIDPCPFWDDDGRAWIIHGWARSRAGFANRLDLVEIDAGLTRTIGEPRVAVDGDSIAGCTVLEGPKLYRRGDSYWIFAPAGGVETGWQFAFRAASLVGPWEPRIVLQQGGTDVNGPHQGAWVIGTGGEEWFLHFQHTPLHGRIPHLQPLSWTTDGWPLVGSSVSGGPAEPVATWKRPTPRPAPEPPTAGGSTIGWHGRGADPVDLVAHETATRVHLRPGGHLARPHDTHTTHVAITLHAGTGALRVFGATTHGVRVEPGTAALETIEERHDTTVVAARLPAELAVVFHDGAARFSVDGAPVGSAFALEPAQWTGIDIAIGAEGHDLAVFEIPST